jgi:hypothetical protein
LSQGATDERDDEKHGEESDGDGQRRTSFRLHKTIKSRHVERQKKTAFVDGSGTDVIVEMLTEPDDGKLDCGNVETEPDVPPIDEY